MLKIPTRAEYQAYDGAHCHVLFHSLSELWRCPSCNRTKFEIMRWTKRNTGMGWLCGLHTHHDHSEPLQLFNLPQIQKARFEPTIICDQCNMVDATVKRRYSEIPHSFSFAPDEIQQIVFARPHTPHVIKYLTAMRIYERIVNHVL